MNLEDKARRILELDAKGYSCDECDGGAGVELARAYFRLKSALEFIFQADHNFNITKSMMAERARDALKDEEQTDLETTKNLCAA